MRKVVKAISPKVAAILGNNCKLIQPGSHNTLLKKFNGITLSFLLFVLRRFGNIVCTGLTICLWAFLQTYL